MRKVFLAMGLSVLLLVSSCDIISLAGNESCFVTFRSSQDGSIVDRISVKKGTALMEIEALEIPTPKKTDGVFRFWSDDGVTKFDFETKIKDDVTLVAVWKTEFKLGDDGPAGGYVFYDCDEDNSEENDGNGPDGLSSEKEGWRYLEIAKKAWGNQSLGASAIDTETWGLKGVPCGTKTGIGEGKNNTIILASKGRTFPAAYWVWNGSLDDFSDWFIPSKDELDAINKILVETNIMPSLKGWDLMSSSEYDNDSFWYFDCSKYGKRRFATKTRDGIGCIVPVRSF